MSIVQVIILHLSFELDLHYYITVQKSVASCIAHRVPLQLRTVCHIFYIPVCFTHPSEGLCGDYAHIHDKSY